MASSSTPHSRATIIQAPSPLPPPSSRTDPRPVLFLSGSILPAPLPPWQSTLSTAVAYLDVTVLNPLNPNWDSTWIEDISCPPFHQQVKWELAGLERANIIAVFFAANTVAAITLMELGLFIQQGKKVVVGCQEGFWKRGNVQVVCERFGVKLVGTLEELIEGVEIVVQETVFESVQNADE